MSRTCRHIPEAAQVRTPNGPEPARGTREGVPVGGPGRPPGPLHGDPVTSATHGDSRRVARS
jgi:hypothetical protein